MNRLLSVFFSFNRKICNAIEGLLPQQFKRHLHTSYKYLVAGRLNAAHGLVVVDVGGGKECPYLRFASRPDSHIVIATDVSAEELRQNTDCRMRAVADAASADLPFRSDSVDMVTSRSVVEHLRDNEAFFRSCCRVLRPGGYVVHTFPCRFAPFALLNALLPDWLARSLLYYFHPAWREACGFKAYYDRCSYREMLRLLDLAGYDLVECEIRYYQAIYYTFFAPLYVLMVVYDLLLWLCSVRNLSCQLLIVARKRDVEIAVDAPARTGVAPN